MSEPITKQELIDASADALTLEQVVNGSDTTDVTSRLARTYPTMSKALRLIVEAGLLGATPFTTKTALDASALADGAYAVVTNDRDGGGVPTAQNGFWIKASGTWQFLAWNPLAQAIALVNAEQTARINADNALQTALNTEQSARIAADNELIELLEAEEAARTNADNTLQTNLTAEQTARISGDDALTDLIDAEEIARTGADATLQANINAEAATRASADSANAAAIAAEVSTRTAQVATLNADFAAAISDEEDARIAEDDALSDAIDAEEAARIAADTAQQNNLNSEAATRASADSANAAAIATEQSARIAGDAQLNADFAQAIMDEEDARIAADGALQADVDQNAAAIAEEVSTRTTAIDLINTALSKIFGAVRFNGYHDDAGNSYLFALVDNQRIGFGITTKLKVIWGNKQIVQDEVAGVKDRFGRYVLAITKNGKVYIPHLVLPASLTTLLSGLSTQITDEVAARIAGDNTNTSAINTNSANLAALSSNFAVASGVHDDRGNSYLLALINRTSGKIAFGVTSKIGLMLKNTLLAQSDQPLLVQDRLKRTVLVVTQSGKVRIPKLVLSDEQLAQIPTPIGSKLSTQLQPFVLAQVNHILFDGQSLSIGSFTVTPISTTQPYSNLTFASGPTRGVDSGAYTPTNIVPLVESNSVESPVSGAANGFVRRVVAVGGAATDYVMFGTSSGVGGRTVAQLTAEDLYVRMRRHIIDAKAAAVAAGKTYAVAAIVWVQGEADLAGSSSWSRAIDYYQRYLFLMTKIRNDAIGASEQSFAPYVFSYQTAAHMYYNKRYLGIAIAQWRASVERQDVVLATPAYRLPHATDNLHLTNEGSWLLGEYVARAMYWTLIKGQKWRPLEPIDVTWTSTHIDVRYHVPCKPIQLSTVICNAATNQGFDIWTNGSVYDSGTTSNDDTLISNAISSVTVLSDDTIRITFNSAVTIPPEAVLSYGRGRAGDSQTSGPVTGARGNVVDSHGIYDKATAPTGTVFDLYNVGVYFEHGRKDGFF